MELPLNVPLCYILTCYAIDLKAHSWFTPRYIVIKGKIYGCDHNEAACKDLCVYDPTGTAYCVLPDSRASTGKEGEVLFANLFACEWDEAECYSLFSARRGCAPILHLAPRERDVQRKGAAKLVEIHRTVHGQRLQLYPRQNDCVSVHIGCDEGQKAR